MKLTDSVIDFGVVFVLFLLTGLLLLIYSSFTHSARYQTYYYQITLNNMATT